MDCTLSTPQCWFYDLVQCTRGVDNYSFQLHSDLNETLPKYFAKRYMGHSNKLLSLNYIKTIKTTFYASFDCLQAFSELQI